MLLCYQLLPIYVQVKEKLSLADLHANITGEKLGVGIVQQTATFKIIAISSNHNVVMDMVDEHHCSIFYQLFFDLFEILCLTSSYLVYSSLFLFSVCPPAIVSIFV